MNLDRGNDLEKFIEILEDRLEFGLAPSEEEVKLAVKFLRAQKSKINTYEKIIREGRHIIST